MATTIRYYQNEDESELHRIHDRARPIELDGSCDPRAFVPLLNDKEDLAEFNAATKFVAVDGQKILGFIGIDNSTVGWLYVDPEEARKGIGRNLLQHALTLIPGQAEVFVLDGNKAAINLYQGEGFIQTEQFKSKNNGYPCTVLKLIKTI